MLIERPPLIRTAAFDDIPLMVDIYESACQKMPPCDRAAYLSNARDIETGYATHMTGLMLQPNTYAYLATPCDATTPEALIAFTVNKDFDNVFVEDVYNASQQRLGAHVMNMAIEIAQKRNISHIVLDAVSDSIGVYEEMGFVLISDGGVHKKTMMRSTDSAIPLPTHKKMARQRGAIFY